MPFWLFGAVTGLQLSPGLPVSSLMTFCPLMAAVILVYKEDGPAGALALLKRSFDYKRIGGKVWYIPIVLLMPGLFVLAYGVMHLAGFSLPNPQFPVLAALAMLLVFFIAALGEELGWSGYVIDPMQARWSALQASIVLGLVWAAWHIVPIAQTHRPPAWITWQCLTLVASRVLFVWLYNNTGRSVFSATLFHAVGNVCYFFFPNYGSHYDPRVTGVIVIVTAAIVTVLWGPRTLARFRASAQAA